MITVNNKTWTEQEIIQLIEDAQLIAEFIRMDLGTIEDNEDTMALETYTNFSNKY
jgi:cell division protein FtsB